MKRIKQSKTFRKDAKTRRKQDKIKMYNKEFDDLESRESMTPIKNKYQEEEIYENN